MKRRSSKVRDPLGELEGLRSVFDRKAAARKRALIADLARERFGSAGELHRFHEALCFIRAYPDDRRTLSEAEAVLAGFPRRKDFAAFREEMENSGIVGTDITYRFYEPMSSWLVERWPKKLSIDWDDFAASERLMLLMPLLTHYSESPGFDETGWDAKAWLRRLKGRGETDAAFLVRRFHAAFPNTFQREILLDELDPGMRLKPGKDTPSRSLARWSRARPHLRKTPFARKRPNLERGLRQRPGVREVNARDGQELIDLARSAMVTRSRDLDAFSFADPNDVRLVEFDDGLQFAAMGQLPERRLMFESVYGYLTLKSGVPMGYVLTGCLYGSAEVAYNVFDTYRGGEAADIYARVLAMTRHLFAADTFMIPPYQLGEGNREALESGAWWFYQKLGFRPDDPAIVKLMNDELGRMEKNPKHRSSIATLDRLSSQPVFWSPKGRRNDVMGRLPLGMVSIEVSKLLAERFGSDREAATATLSLEAMQALGLESLDEFSVGEHLAWERWAPVIALIRSVKRWTPAEKRALVNVVRAKGGRRESDFVNLFDRHKRLRGALRRIAVRAG